MWCAASAEQLRGYGALAPQRTHPSEARTIGVASSADRSEEKDQILPKYPPEWRERLAAPALFVHRLITSCFRHRSRPHKDVRHKKMKKNLLLQLLYRVPDALEYIQAGDKDVMLPCKTVL